MSNQDPYLISGTETPEVRQLAEHPTVEKRARRALVIATVSVGIALVAAFFGFLQWKAANRQADIADRALKLAEKSAQDEASDIQRSRTAAESSASAARELARSNASMAETMRGQQRTMQSQLELQERPWIKITDVQTRGNGPTVPALSFQNGMGAGRPFQQTTFQLAVTVKNIGHSVAEVTVRPDLFLAPWSSGSFFDAVTKEQKSFCESDLGSARSGYYPSFVVFPEEPFDWTGAGAKIVDPDHISKFTDAGNTEFVVPVAIICVNYRLKSLPNSYQTSAVYEVFRKDNRTRFFERGIGVPADKIFLIRDPQLDYLH